MTVLLLLPLAVAKLEAPAITRTAPGFAIFLTTFFLCGCGQDDVISIYSLVASKFSPSVKLIV